MKLAGTVLWEDIKKGLLTKKESDRVRRALEKTIKELGASNYPVPLGVTLIRAFHWQKSSQGQAYWEQLYDAIKAERGIAK